eukprot:scaffold473_cov156-Amphora_coffeaeformis.AAC.15
MNHRKDLICERGAFVLTKVLLSAYRSRSSCEIMQNTVCYCGNPLLPVVGYHTIVRPPQGNSTIATLTPTGVEYPPSCAHHVRRRYVHIQKIFSWPHNFVV